MTEHKLTPLDMKQLEEQLQSAIQQDTKYWQQNEAKLKAVSDHVETYEDFKNLVDAAHLKPLEKSDKINKEKLTQTIWNKYAERGGKADGSNSRDGCNVEQNDPIKAKPDMKDAKLEEDAVKVDRENFVDMLIQSQNKLTFLSNLGAPRFVEIFRNEISTSTLLQVLKVVSDFDRNDVGQIVFVAEFLSELINIERFSLTLSFLTSEEKQTVENLFEKLTSCFILKSSELRELDLDEDHVATLRIVYQL